MVKLGLPLNVNIYKLSSLLAQFMKNTKVVAIIIVICSHSLGYMCDDIALVTCVKT